MKFPSYDKRPVWEQMGIKKFKRDGSVVFEWGRYEIELDCPDCDEHYYYLRVVGSEDTIHIHDFEGLAQFIDTIRTHKYDIPYPPLPTEQEIKIKEAEQRLKIADEQCRAIRDEIRNLKYKYED